MTDDDLIITALRYAMTAVIREHIDRSASKEDAVRQLAVAFQQAVNIAMEKRHEVTE